MFTESRLFAAMLAADEGFTPFATQAVGERQQALLRSGERLPVRAQGRRTGAAFPPPGESPVRPAVRPAPACGLSGRDLAAQAGVLRFELADSPFEAAHPLSPPPKKGIVVPPVFPHRFSKRFGGGSGATTRKTAPRIHRAADEWASLRAVATQKNWPAPLAAPCRALACLRCAQRTATSRYENALSCWPPAALTGYRSGRHAR
jgi:hypothetical protein